jgi:hypothetical protein
MLERRVQLANGWLTFRSETQLDPPSHRLLIREEFTLQQGESVSRYEDKFEMRCWSKEELAASFEKFCFTDVEYFDDYSNGPSSWSDRIVCVAQKAAGFGMNILRPSFQR